MRTYLLSKYFVSFVFLMFAQWAQAFVTFEVQPLSIHAQNQVIGVQVGQNVQQRAIIFTGDAAARIAQAAGVAFNATTEMIVMTGVEAAKLVGSAIGTAYTAGKLVLITSAAFAAAGIDMALKAIAIGAEVAWLGITTAATIGKEVVGYTLLGLKGAYYIVTGTGIFLVKGASALVFGTLEFVCRIPGYLLLGVLGCQ